MNPSVDWLAYLVFAAVFLVLYDISLYNYLFYHTTIELFAIFVGFSLSLIAIVTLPISRNKLFTKIGIIYLFVAIVDYVHTLAYKGMNIFAGWTANEPTQLWILGRTMEAIGFFLLFYLNLQERSDRWFFAGYSVATLVGLTAVGFGLFPDCFIEGHGLTTFKVAMEYVIVVLSILTIVKIRFFRFGETETSNVLDKDIELSLVFTILGELSFTLYTDVYGFFNFLGHVFRFLSYYVLLRGLVVRALVDPVNTLFRELNSKNEELERIAYYDKVTGLYSRSFFEEVLKKHLNLVDRTKRSSGLLLIDVDNMKWINDTHGHLVGDQVLSFVGETIRRVVRSADIAARWGGDEFIIVMPESGAFEANVVGERIRTEISSHYQFSFPVRVSYGIAEFANGADFEFAFKTADSILYEMKRRTH